MSAPIDPLFDEVVSRARNKFNFDRVRISGLWAISLLYKPDPIERTFRYQVILAQTSVGQGAAYANGGLRQSDLSGMIGRNASALDFTSTEAYALNIAVLDSLMRSVRPKPSRHVTLSGRSAVKASRRASIVVSEGLRLLRHHRILTPRGHRTPRVLNIGFVEHFHRAFARARSVDFLATDLDPDLIGKRVGGVKILNGNTYNRRLIPEVDLVLVTGMALVTGTMTEILNLASAAEVPVLVFAETGSSFASFYLEHGAGCVVGEPFPFYIFDGLSNIEVFRGGRT